MATTESSAANSASQIPRYPIDSSLSRSRLDSSPWIPGGSGSGSGSGSGAIHDDQAPSVSLHDPFFPPSDHDNADKKPVWNKPSSSSAEVCPVMGAESWPALSLSARPSSNKSPSSQDLSDGSSSPIPMPIPMPQAAGTPLSSTSNANSSINANAVSTAAATSSQNHNVNGQRKPFRRNNSTSSSTSNPPTNAAPFNTRDQNHSQRGGSYSSGTTQSRNPHRFRNGGNSYPRGDGLHHGNRRNFDQSGFSHRNFNGRDMHLQPQRGFGMMRPQMLMGPPSFPASSAQYMAAPQIGSYGGPMLYPDYAPHVFMPHPPQESMALVGHFPPLPMYYPSFDAMLYNKILTQVEYYFSADNLSKDKHLRRQMNDEGWVSVRVIAGFRRLAELTNNTQTILEALRGSEVVEIKGEALRRRGDWDKYLLPHEASRSGPAAAGNNKASLGSQLGSMTLSERSREEEW